MRSDRIVVLGIRVEAHVGVGDEERGTPQGIEVDVGLRLDLARAGTTDDLAETVDYEAVCALVEAVAASRAFRLIEAVAEECAQALLDRFDVRGVRVRVRKPGALRRWGVPHAEVEVRRRRDA